MAVKQVLSASEFYVNHALIINRTELLMIQDVLISTVSEIGGLIQEDPVIIHTRLLAGVHQ